MDLHVHNWVPQEMELTELIQLSYLEDVHERLQISDTGQYSVLHIHCSGPVFRLGELAVQGLHSDNFH